jgi:hypothetical protein
MAVKTQNIRPRVISWFERHPNEIATKDRIANDLGLNPRQVQQAMSLWIREGGGDMITTVAQGNAWQYKPGANSAAAPPAPAKPAQATTVEAGQVFEQVGVDGKRAPIVKGEDGRMWRLIPL